MFLFFLLSLLSPSLLCDREREEGSRLINDSQQEATGAITELLGKYSNILSVGEQRRLAPPKLEDLSAQVIISLAKIVLSASSEVCLAGVCHE